LSYRAFLTVSPAPLAILSNRLSTQNRAAAGWLDDIIAGQAWIRRFDIDDITAIPGMLAECAAAGIGTVCVDGGDGTAGLVFSALINGRPYDTPPALALLPSGKTNMTAEAWSLVGDRREALAGVIARHAAGTLEQTVHEHPVLAVHEDGRPARYGAFFGAADVVDGILYCRRAIYPKGWPNTISHSAAIGVLLWKAMTAGQKGGVVEVRGKDADDAWQEDGRFFVVMATTMSRLLLGLSPQPVIGQGAVQYLSLRPGPRAVLSTVPGIVSKRVGPGAARTVRRTDTAAFTFAGAYTLDGELYEATADKPVTVDGSSTLRFIRW
jgi:hypothetical protein